MSDYEEYAADEKRDEMRDDRLIHKSEGNQPESREKPLQPVKNDDERIREAFDAWSNYEYVVGKFHDDHVFTVQDVVYCMGIVEERFKSRDEEVDWLRSCNHTHMEQMQRKDKEITALRAQIEEMKSCLICDIRKDKYGYKKWSPCLQCENHSNFTVKKGGSDESNNNS